MQLPLSCLSHVKRTHGSNERPPAPPQVVFLHVAVDRSGSMASYGSSIIEQTHSLISKQQKFAKDTEIPTYMTLTTFDDVSEKKMSICLNTELPPTVYQLHRWLCPRNCTRLIDTAIECVDDITHTSEKYINDLNKEVRRDLLNENSIKMIFALFTDGHDNASNMSARDLNKKIKIFQNNSGVAMFLAANQDAIHTGGRYGFSADTSLTVGTSSLTATSALQHTSDLIRSASSGAREVSYTMAMREESQDSIDLSVNNLQIPIRM